MKKLHRILSTFLALLMMISAISGMSVISASAASDDAYGEEIANKYGKDTVYNTPEEKLADMEMMFAKHGYELYVEKETGEVAIKETITGQILFSNPYDVASSHSDITTVKRDLLSQIFINYLDKSNNNNKGTLNSFWDSAARGQLSVSRIKNGVRVEYTIGEQVTKRLVPRRLTSDSYEKYILGPITEAYYENEALIESGELEENDIDLEIFKDSLNPASGLYYSIISLDDVKTEDNRKDMIEKFPILETSNLWILSADLIDSELAQIETLIMKYCLDYTYEQMEEDHEITGYRGLDVVYPLFKLALEYSIEEDGLTVRLPANGLRYDTDSFFLDSIQVLPYMGAGHIENGGYTFFPDGSGSLFDFTDLKNSSLTFTQPIYGIDYAYNKIDELGYRTPVRYPVYGVVANEQFYTYTYRDKSGNTVAPTTVSSTVKSKEDIKSEVEKVGGTNLVIDDQSKYTRGYVAIIESGDSMTKLTASQFPFIQNEYATVINAFNPVPYDEFDLSDTISVSGDTRFLVISPRKFTGALQIRYKMLSDPQAVAAAQATNPAYKGYDTSWLGMAEYYRDYLIKGGTLDRLTADEVEADIPLYIEAFGAIETQQMVMTFPVDVMTPLTTFENIGQMFDQLSGLNVKNINFKMTGFANGGMYSTVPSSLKWESAVGGKSGFRDLIEKAKAINAAEDDLHLGLYPDFDFAHISDDKLFDSTNLRKDAVTSIDNRYTSKRFYSASQQKYMTFYQLLVSPSRYDKFYTKLMDNYADYDISSISLGSLGNSLNSDFDEDEAYVREESKQQTQDALNAIKNSNNKQYDVMLDGANAYTWKYANHIINLDLESSRHNKSSATVPFIGAVLHGYVQFAGTPLNEEGNISNALLKAVENGAGMYFILSFQSENIPYLKEDLFLSQYYSVRYDIWYQDVAKYYNQLNDLLKDVQTKVIVQHEFINDNIERIMSIDELEELIQSELQSAISSSNKEHSEVNLGTVTTIADARAYVAEILENKGSMAKLTAFLNDMKNANATITEQYDLLKAEVDGFVTFRDTTLATPGANITRTVGNKLKEIKGYAVGVMSASVTVKEQNYNATKLLAKLTEALADAKEVINATDDLSASIKAGYLAEIAAAEALLSTYATELAAENVLNTAKYDTTTEQSAEQYAIKVLDQVVVEGEHKEALEAVLKAQSANKYVFTKEEILAEGRFVEPTEEDEATNTNSSYNVLSVDKNSVVAVTYGDVVTDENGVTQKTLYKTFLLNYNSYAVRLTYNGVLYTIPAGGCVALYR